MRVATYNIRNGRAVDPSSFWWRRRKSLARVIERIDADVWAFQEVYGFQRRYLERVALPGPDWVGAGEGRKGGGRGEQVPVVHRREFFAEATAMTRWFGPTPDVPGSKMTGAKLARIATIADLTATGSLEVRVVNVHLDSDSTERRAASIRQISEWVDTSTPTIVMGDFNGRMSEPGYESLADAGLRSALEGDAGPTSNGFGRRLDQQHQIDHVFTSPHFRVRRAEIDLDAGYASDHYPVVVDLDLAES